MHCGWIHLKVTFLYKLAFDKEFMNSKEVLIKEHVCIYVYLKDNNNKCIRTVSVR